MRGCSSLKVTSSGKPTPRCDDSPEYCNRRTLCFDRGSACSLAARVCREAAGLGLSKASRKLTPNLRPGKPREVAPWRQRHASAKATRDGLASVFRRGAPHLTHWRNFWWTKGQTLQDSGMTVGIRALSFGFLRPLKQARNRQELAFGRKQPLVTANHQGLKNETS